jgi:ribosomal protein S18 acetylase RimI-like enzyme
MNDGWPAVERGAVEGWALRFAAGVTRRANSVLPLQTPDDVEAAVAEVERRSAERWLDPVFQISPASLPEDLDELLARRGYAAGSPTLVQIMEGSELLRFYGIAVDPRVELSDAPDEQWLDLFWEVEGPQAPEDRAVSRQILGGSPAVYASLRIDGTTAAIARMALVGEYGGMYCVVTREESRRQGLSRLVLEALMANAADRGLEGLWLQVRESNVAAILLYDELGFTTASSYHYRTRAL